MNLMDKMQYLLRLIVIFFTCLIGMASTETLAREFECWTNTPPPPRDGIIDYSDFKFSWYSDANEEPDGRYCYEKIVKNQHDEKPLNYNWPIAGMQNSALNSGKLNRQAWRMGKYFKDAIPGPLYYGEKLQNQTPTEVWRSESEQESQKLVRISSFPALETILEFVFESNGQTYYNSIILRSLASLNEDKNGKYYRFTYLFENPGETSVIAWVPNLPEMAQKSLKSKYPPPEMIKIESGSAFRIIQRISMITNVSDQQPVMSIFPVYFFDPKLLKRMAKGQAPAYVPGN